MAEAIVHDRWLALSTVQPMNYVVDTENGELYL